MIGLTSVPRRGVTPLVSRGDLNRAIEGEARGTSLPTCATSVRPAAETAGKKRRDERQEKVSIFVVLM